MPVFIDEDEMYEGDKNCRDTDFEKWALAMAYVPWQSWETPFEPDTALEHGSLFSALVLPFEGGAV